MKYYKDDNFVQIRGKKTHIPEVGLAGAQERTVPTNIRTIILYGSNGRALGRKRSFSTRVTTTLFWCVLCPREEEGISGM